MNITTRSNTLYSFAAAAAMGIMLYSCKDAEPKNTDEGTAVEATETRSDTMDRDADTSDSLNTVDPDTIMGP